MFDTHCHLNFQAFDQNVDEIIKKAKEVDISYITIPGTDIPTSKKAIAIAEKYDDVYAAVGVHPHHIASFVIPSAVEGSLADASSNKLRDSSVVLDQIEELLRNDKKGKVVAIGEIGLDRYLYTNTKYSQYTVDEKFIELQKTFFVKQLELAKEFGKSVIVHNREAKQDLLPLLREHWDSFFEQRMVFHCCEPDEELLEFAIQHRVLIGVDGDVTHNSSTGSEKRKFIKKVPLEMLVLETDSPFLIPEPLKSQKVFPNKPENLKIIAEFVAKIRNESEEMIAKKTKENAKLLFKIDG